MNKKMLHIVAFTLLAVGGVNVGLEGLLDFNLINVVLGAWVFVEKLLYILIGASAVYVFAGHKADCKICSAK